MGANGRIVVPTVERGAWGRRDALSEPRGFPLTCRRRSSKLVSAPDTTVCCKIEGRFPAEDCRTTFVGRERFTGADAFGLETTAIPPAAPVNGADGAEVGRTRADGKGVEGDGEGPPRGA